MSKSDTTDYYGLIEAFVEGYRGSRDAPGFDACVRAEINKRLSDAYAEIEGQRKIALRGY